jgi:hypothetical protein
LETVGDLWLDGETESAGVKYVPEGEDLSTASPTLCWEYSDEEAQTHRRYYFQAQQESIVIRELDADANLENNTGRITYKIWDVAEFRRAPLACELAYRIDDLQWTREIQASASNGTGLLPTTFNPLQWEEQNSDSLVKGQIYVIETSGPPATVAGNDLWDIEISDDNRATWQLLQDWPQALCVVPLDTMGQQWRIYFLNEGDEAGTNIFLRVDNGLGAQYSLMEGYRTVQVFGATNLQVVTDLGENACDNSYSAPDVGAVTVYPPVTAELGTAAPALTRGQIYAATTVNTWLDGALEFTAAAISDDGGTTWYSFGSYPHALCVQAVGDNLQMFFRPEIGKDYRFRAYDVDTLWFNNTDPGTKWGIDVVAANVRIDPWNTCTVDYRWFQIKSRIPIYSEYDPANAPQELNLVPGEMYYLRIVEGSFTDEGFTEDPSRPLYDAKISMDNRETWHEFGSPDFPGATCAAKYPLYQAVYFVASHDPSAGIRAFISVNDRDGNYANNEGILYYDLAAAIADTDGATEPDINKYLPPMWSTGCFTQPTRPMDALDIAGWIDYVGSNMQRYFLWCPQHTSVIQAMMDAQTDREPFYTFGRLMSMGARIFGAFSTYQWSAEDEDPLPYLASGGGDTAPSLIPTLQDTPWAGGEIVFNPATGGEEAQNLSCEANLVFRLGEGSGLATGFCTIMVGVKMVGAHVYFNMINVTVVAILTVRYFINRINRIIASYSIARLA